MIFFKGTVKGLRTDTEGGKETVLILRAPGTEYSRVTDIGQLDKQVLVFGVFTEAEFTEWSEMALKKDS